MMEGQKYREKHITADALVVIDDDWDMIIAHPVCTYLSNSGAKHLYRGMNKKNGINPVRWKNMEYAARFFKKFLDAPAKKKAVENPIIHGHAKALIGRGPSQIIQPWWFGHKEMKATGLWLDGLPPLVHTNNVGPPPKDANERLKWAKIHRMAPGPDRQMLRSLTFAGIADAMAEQWG